MATPMHDLLEIDDYTRFFWEAYRNNELYVNQLSAIQAGVTASSNLISALAYNPYGIDQPVDNQGNLSSTATWNTDWKDAILNSNAYKIQHGISISGGSEKQTSIWVPTTLKKRPVKQPISNALPPDST